MPVYRYHCEANGRTIDVEHPMDVVLRHWGELCFVSREPLGDTDPLAPVRKVLTPPAVQVPVSDSRLKELGFTKLVRRDQGVFENVTACDGESRYMRAGDASTLPDLRRRLRD